MSELAAAKAPRPQLRIAREVGLAVVLVLVVGFLALTVQYFFSPENLLRVLRDQAHVAVLATGMTLVILTGGIDLSVGSIVALAAVVMGVVWKSAGSWPVAAGAALATGAVCGSVNGAAVAYARVPPLIVTLATLSVFRGLAFAVGGSNTVGKFDPALLQFSRGDFAGLPLPLWLTALLFVGVSIYLARTDGGRAVYAIGANSGASRLSGVPVQAIRFRVYLVSGVLAAIAALLYAARTDAVKPDIGVEYELLAITAVVLGGTSVAGGEGSVAGTAIAYLLLVLLQNGLYLGSSKFGLPLEFQGVVVAVLLVGSLLLDGAMRRRRAGV